MLLLWPQIACVLLASAAKELHFEDEEPGASVLLQTSLLLDRTPMSSHHSLASGTILFDPNDQSFEAAEQRKFRLSLAISSAMLTLAVSCLLCRRCAFVEEHEKRHQTDCYGLCPCLVRGDVPESDLHSWEMSGKDLFGSCPGCLPFPRDLTARQWTWRLAEINVWIQLVATAYEVHRCLLLPRAVLKDLQLTFACVMFAATLSAAWSVHRRAVGMMIQYVFCAMVTKALYVAAKYAMMSGFITACSLKQISFEGCQPKGTLATCLLDNTCTQAMLDKVSGCDAPGADTCASLHYSFPETGQGIRVFIHDILDILLFLFGIVPIFMAALAKESRGYGKASPEDLSVAECSQAEAPQLPQSARRNDAG